MTKKTTKTGNKTAGRNLASLEYGDYVKAMGGDVANLVNTGVSYTNAEVYKYFKLLRTYALNRIEWTSDQIPKDELRLIEWNVFKYGYCAMLRPTITNKGYRYQTKAIKIYKCNSTEINYRNGQPLSISILRTDSENLIIDVNYKADAFTIFTDDYLFSQDSNPFINIAWEFACKLHELDLAFNANSHKNRIPIIFNKGNSTQQKEGIFNNAASALFSVAEIIRSAFGRNEQFVDIPENLVGKDGFLHEAKYVENHMLEHLEAQKKLYQAYFELLGLYTNKEKGGVYTVKRLQEDGDETGDFITKCLKSTRVLCAEKACKMFGINLKLEVK